MKVCIYILFEAIQGLIVLTAVFAKMRPLDMKVLQLPICPENMGGVTGDFGSCSFSTSKDFHLLWKASVAASLSHKTQISSPHFSVLLP